MSKQTESLMKKMMEVRQMVSSACVRAECARVCARVACNVCRVCVQNKEEEAAEEAGGGVSRAGYLFLMEKSECLL